MDATFFETRGVDMGMDTGFFENRGVDMDTEFFENRGVDVDMDTAWNRCPPNSKNFLLTNYLTLKSIIYGMFEEEP